VLGDIDGPRLRASEAATFSLPASWGQSLVDGTAGGIQFYDNDGSPRARLDGRGSWGPSFTLTLNWQRVV